MFCSRYDSFTSYLPDSFSTDELAFIEFIIFRTTARPDESSSTSTTPGLTVISETSQASYETTTNNPNKQTATVDAKKITSTTVGGQETMHHPCFLVCPYILIRLKFLFSSLCIPMLS